MILDGDKGAELHLVLVLVAYTTGRIRTPVGWSGKKAAQRVSLQQKLSRLVRVS